MKSLQARRHSNGRTAEVKLQRDGRFYACYSPPPHTGARSVSYGSDVESLLRAQHLADYFAHPGCDGVGCGAWQNDHGDDPECLAVLRRETSGSSKSD